ncbi:MAG: hypothetical protein R3C58_00950 [Parvularculaceae bacterium]
MRHYTTLDSGDAGRHSPHRTSGSRAHPRKEMAVVIKKTGFDGTFAEFLDYLRTDEQFLCKDA